MFFAFNLEQIGRGLPHPKNNILNKLLVYQVYYFLSNVLLDCGVVPRNGWGLWYNKDRGACNNFEKNRYEDPGVLLGITAKHCIQFLFRHVFQLQLQKSNSRNNLITIHFFSNVTSNLQLMTLSVLCTNNVIITICMVVTNVSEVGRFVSWASGWFPQQRSQPRSWHKCW